MAYSLTEQETVIQIDRKGTSANIYTSDMSMMTKLDKKYKRSNAYTKDGEVVAAEYAIDASLLSFRNKKRKLSEKHKAALQTNRKK